MLGRNLLIAIALVLSAQPALAMVEPDNCWVMDNLDTAWNRNGPLDSVVAIRGGDCVAQDEAPGGVPVPSVPPEADLPVPGGGVGVPLPDGALCLWACGIDQRAECTSSMEGIGPNVACKYMGSCTGTGRWNVHVKVLEGNGGVAGWMECSGVTVASCSVAGYAGSFKDCPLQNDGEGAGYCYVTADPGVRGWAACEDPADPEKVQREGIAIIGELAGALP